VQPQILRLATVLPVSVHDTTVDPVTVVEVRVDFSTRDCCLMLEDVKVDNLTVELSMLESVNVESDVRSFVHVDLVGVLPFPEQSPA